MRRPAEDRLIRARAHWQYCSHARNTDFSRDPFHNRRGDIRVDFLWGALAAEPSN